MTTILYGIPNCDTVKKAQKWLLQNNIPFQFHDYRKDGLDHQLLDSFLVNLSWTELLNKRSTSYRQLTEQQKSAISADNVCDLLIEFPTLIKRPLLIHGDTYQLGFKNEIYNDIFSL